MKVKIEGDRVLLHSFVQVLCFKLRTLFNVFIQPFESLNKKKILRIKLIRV